MIISRFSGNFPAKPALILRISVCKHHRSIFQLWFGYSPHACYLWVNDHFKGVGNLLPRDFCKWKFSYNRFSSNVIWYNYHFQIYDINTYDSLVNRTFQTMDFHTIHFHKYNISYMILFLPTWAHTIFSYPWDVLENDWFSTRSIFSNRISYILMHNIILRQES